MFSTSKRLVTAAVLGVAATLPVTASAAGTALSTIPVSTIVQPSALVKFEVIPISISISAADIARGYIDIPVGSLLSIKAGQSLPPVIIDFSMGDGVFKSVEVREPDTAKSESAEATRRKELVSDSDTPELASKKSAESLDVGETKKISDSEMRSGAARDRNTAIAYRFKLSDKARPGDYQVPIILNITF